MLYVFNQFSLITEESLQEMIQEMPKERRKKANQYQQLEDKKACAMAYYLLRQGLKEEYGIEKKPTFLYNEYGKPFLKENPKIFFSISHTKSIVACVISDVEVGVDVEEVREVSPRVVDKMLNEKEKSQVKSEKDFIKYWTMKEAIAKCEGTGLAHFDFKNIDYDQYQFDMRYYAENNAYLTVCYKK